MILLKKYSLFIPFVLITSCISYRFIDIQVLNPAQAKLPPGITLHILEPEKTNNILNDSALVINLHKQAIHNFDSTFKQYFEKSPMFEKSKAVIQTKKEFQQEMKNKSIEDQKKDILLDIKLFEIVEKNLGINKKINFIDNFNEADDLMFVRKFIYRINIQLINMGTDQVYDSYLFSDTLTYSSIYNFKEFAGNDFIFQVVSEIGKLAADQYADKTAPVWVTEERMLYYNGNKYMRSGYKEFVLDDYEGAVGSWKHLVAVGTPSLASSAAHNIALVYEMKDDIDSCETWLNSSLKIKYRLETDEYLTRIKERLLTRKKMDKQLVRP